MQRVIQRPGTLITQKDEIFRLKNKDDKMDHLIHPHKNQFEKKMFSCLTASFAEGRIEKLFVYNKNRL